MLKKQKIMQIGNKQFNIGDHTYVMGILNVTPDSFSDGNQWNVLDKALMRVEEMLAEGMDILDIGGESTRPGHKQISVQEEIERVVPVIEAVKARFDVPVSLDTYKAEVARAGIAAGADMINDIWGLKYDKNMAKVIAEGNVACCLMHNRKDPEYHNLLPDFDATENVMLPMLIAGVGTNLARDRAEKLLVRMELSKRLKHRPSEMSGGEQQRVAIARALANAPKLLLADEPTGNLDPKTSEIVFNELLSIVKETGLSALIATHNFDLADRMDRKVQLIDGKLIDLRAENFVSTENFY